MKAEGDSTGDAEPGDEEAGMSMPLTPHRIDGNRRVGLAAVMAVMLAPFGEAIAFEVFGMTGALVVASWLFSMYALVLLLTPRQRP